MKDKLQVAEDIKKMITRLDGVVKNFPRNEYVLKDKIMETSYDMLELVYFANTIDVSERTIAKIRMLDYYLKRSMEKQYLSYKKYEKLGIYLTNILKELYGWLNIEKSRQFI